MACISFIITICLSRSSVTFSKHIASEIYIAKLQESFISLKDLTFLGGVSLDEFSGLIVLLLPSEEECELDRDDTSRDGACTC